MHRFAKPWHRLRALRVFLDQASLAANPGLWPSIQTALDSSQHFLLLASVRSARSTWVERELMYWLNTRGPESVLIVVTDPASDGERPSIVWDAATNDFDWSSTTVLPRCLSGVFPTEPRWVTLGWARSSPKLSLRDVLFQNAVAEIAAPIHGRSKDELVGEDVRQHRRAIRLARIGVTALSIFLIVSFATSFFAFVQLGNAREAQRQAVGRAMLSQSESIQEASPLKAIQLGAAAHWVAPNAQTEANLLDVLTGTRYQGALTATGGIMLSLDTHGQILASGDSKGDVFLWDLADPDHPRQLSQPLAGHLDWVWSVALSPNGRLLAAGARDNTVILWDVSDKTAPRQIAVLAGHAESSRSVDFSRDGRLLAAGSADGSINVWDISDATSPQRLEFPETGHKAKVVSVAFSESKDLLAAGSADGTASLWSVENPTAPRMLGAILEDFGGNERAVAISPDGRTLAFGGPDESLVVWDISDPARAQEYVFGELDESWHRPAGGQALPSGDPRHDQIFIPGGPTGHTDRIWSVVFSRDGGRMVVGSRDNSISLWEVLEPGQVRRIPERLTGHRGSVFSMAFRPDQRTLLSGGGDGNILLWDMTNAHRPHALGEPLQQHSGPVFSVDFRPDGKVLASGSKDRSVVLWDVSGPTPERIGALDEHTDAVHSVSFSPDGQTLASASADKSIILWDVTDPHRARPSAVLRGHEKTVFSVDFSPDGQTLASAGLDQTIRLWDVPTHRQLSGPLSAHRSDIWSVRFSPDGRTLASADDGGQVLLWDVSAPERPSTLGDPLRGHTASATSAVFSPDGRTLAIGSLDRTVILWDVTDPGHPRRLANSLASHSDAVWSLDFSPDGRLLVSTTRDGTLVLWAVADRDVPRQLGNPLPSRTRDPEPGNAWGETVWAVTFSPDGRSLASASEDATWSRWDVSILETIHNDPIGHACARTDGRGPDRDSWEALAPGLPHRDVCARR